MLLVAAALFLQGCASFVTTVVLDELICHGIESSYRKPGELSACLIKPEKK